MIIHCGTCGKDYESPAQVIEDLRKYGQDCPECKEFWDSAIFDSEIPIQE